MRGRRDSAVTVKTRRAAGASRPRGPLFAVQGDALREIDSAATLKPGEVAVTIAHRRREWADEVMPKPKPSDLAFEVWRLFTQEKRTYGAIATRSAVAKYLSPNSRSADPVNVRKTQAKKYVKAVDGFLATPIGVIIQQTEFWREWLATGVDPTRLNIVPFDGYDPSADFRSQNYANFILDRKRR